MVRNLTTFLAPPLAVCRYGCHSHCTPAVAVVWIAGSILLAYFFFGGPHPNDLIHYGSLGLGAALALMSGIWALLTLKRVDDDATLEKRNPNKWCRLFSDIDERDPLKDVDKASHM